jgi:hypothetical protein
MSRRELCIDAAGEPQILERTPLIVNLSLRLTASERTRGAVVALAAKKGFPWPQLRLFSYLAGVSRNLRFGHSVEKNVHQPFVPAK